MNILVLAICGLLAGAFILPLEEKSSKYRLPGLIIVTIPWIVLLLIHVLYKNLEAETMWEYCQIVLFPVLVYLLTMIIGARVALGIRIKRARGF